MTERSNFDHYVAQHFIKLFTDEEDVGYVGSIASKTVESKTDFTQVFGRPNWSYDQQVEDAFSAIENKVANALRTVKEQPESIRGLAPPTVKALKDFVCLHTARSAGIHETMNQASQQTERELRRVAPPGARIPKLRDATRPESLTMGVELSQHVDVMMRMKGCVALLAPGGSQFLLGDEPLVNLSSAQTWLYKGGLPNRDTYFWFPLSPNLGLFFGHEIGEHMSEGRIKVLHASKKLTDIFNRAEVFQAVEYVVGANRGFVKAKIRLPNVGKQRAVVQHMGWAPFMIQSNNCVTDITEDQIDQIRAQLQKITA